MPAPRRPAQDAPALFGKAFVTQATAYAARGLAHLVVWFEGRPVRMSWARVKCRLGYSGGWAYVAKRGLLQYLKAKVELQLFTQACQQQAWVQLWQQGRVQAAGSTTSVLEVVDCIVAAVERRTRVRAFGEMLDSFGLGGERRWIDQLVEQAAAVGWKAVPAGRRAEAH